MLWMLTTFRLTEGVSILVLVRQSHIFHRTFVTTLTT
jgi:hypothetical protein